MNNRETMTAKKKYAGKVIFLIVTGALATAFLFSFSTLLAQAPGGGQGKSIPEGTTRQAITDQEIQLMRQDVRAERRQIVAANLPLTTEESAKFWPIYDQYIAETIKVNDVRQAAIKDYATNYTSLTDAKAAEYMRKQCEVDKATVDLRLKYVPLIEKVLPERKAAIFFQIDRRIQLMIDLQLISQIPMISPK